MSRYTQKQLDDARRAREKAIARLRRCTCAFPVVNGTGHDSKCPEHLHRITERNRDDEGVDYNG